MYEKLVILTLRASSSWRARSTATCRATEWRRPFDPAQDAVVGALNEAGKPLKGSNVLVLKDAAQCWAWRIPLTACGTAQAGH